MNEFKGDVVLPDDASGGSSSDGEVADLAVSTPGRVTSRVKISIDINDYHLMLGHLKARLLKQSAR